jgi:ATP-dependent helicase Lhr and Lhr-like helicase
LASPPSVHDLGISILDASIDQVKDALQRIANFTPGDLKLIEDFARGLCTARFDDYIPDALLRRLWGRRNSQVISSIPEVARTQSAPA